MATTTKEKRKVQRAAKAATKEEQRAAAEQKANEDALRFPERSAEVKLVPGQTPSPVELRSIAKETDRRLRDTSREAANAAARAVHGVLKGGASTDRVARRLRRVAQAGRKLENAS